MSSVDEPPGVPEFGGGPPPGPPDGIAASSASSTLSTDSPSSSARVSAMADRSGGVQTLGHATSGTFPAGGPATTGQFGAGPAGGAPTGGGGGPFGGDTSSLADAVAYADANGGGTIAVSSQSGAAGQLITDGADVAAIGGFSGRESAVSLQWLAQAVEDGRIRYVLTDGGQGLPDDGRVGSSG